MRRGRADVAGGERMEYEHNRPVTKPKRTARREREREQVNERQEKDRQSRAGTGEMNEGKVNQGQNGELGNTSDPRNTTPLGTPGED
jgi:hypothetical protein